MDMRKGLIEHVTEAMKGVGVGAIGDEDHVSTWPYFKPVAELDG